MIGGDGNDAYVVDNAGDTVTEDIGKGEDSVSSTVSFVLGANLEDLQLGGGNINGTGNALDNVILGGAGNNILSGGAGNDELSRICRR